MQNKPTNIFVYVPLGQTDCELKVVYKNEDLCAIDTLKISDEVAIALIAHGIMKIFKIPVTVQDKSISCESTRCYFRNECANHITAGDYRSEYGSTPGLIQDNNDEWFCSREPKEIFKGEVFTDGTHMADYLRSLEEELHEN